MPRKSWAVSSTRSSTSTDWRYQATGGLTFASPLAATISADEPVVGLVLGQALADPAVEGEGPGLRDVAQPSLVLEDRRPLHREQVGVFGPGDEPVDPLRPLGGIGVPLEGDDLGRARASRPQMSSDDRRANSASVQASGGGQAKLSELAGTTSGSMKLPEGGSSLGDGGSTPLGIVARATPTRPPNRAMMAASPTPSIARITPVRVDLGEVERRSTGTGPGG